MRMREKLILRVVGKSFVPFILLFALYVQFHGDFGPGGGFQAGVIFASGIVLYGLIYGLEETQKVLPKAWVETGLALGLLLYAGTGVVGMLRGAEFLNYNVLAHDPHHGQHYGLLLIEGGVGLTVACAMTLIYYLFAGRGRR